MQAIQPTPRGTGLALAPRSGVPVRPRWFTPPGWFHTRERHPASGRGTSQYRSGSHIAVYEIITFLLDLIRLNTGSLPSIQASREYSIMKMLHRQIRGYSRGKRCVRRGFPAASTVATHPAANFARSFALLSLDSRNPIRTAKHCFNRFSMRLVRGWRAGRHRCRANARPPGSTPGTPPAVPAASGATASATRTARSPAPSLPPASRVLAMMRAVRAGVDLALVVTEHPSEAV